MRSLVMMGAVVALAACTPESRVPTLSNEPPGAPGGSNAAASYTQLSLGTLGGAHSTAVDINSSGEVAGTWLMAGNRTHAFRWSAAGGMQDLPPLAGDTDSFAVAINDDGTILGYSFGTRPRTVIWSRTGAVSVPIPEFPSINLTPLDFNKKGEIVGSELPTSLIPRATVWSPTDGKTNLVAPGAIGIDGSTALRVNDKGEVCTVQAEAHHPNTNYNVHRSYFWSRAGGFVAVGDPLNATARNLQVTCYGLNNHGVMVGSAATVLVSEYVGVPFIWSPKYGVRVLPLGEFGFGAAMGISNKGVIVGNISSYAGVNSRATVWLSESAAPQLLSADQTSGGGARAINGKGVIVGTHNGVATMWTPTK